MAGLGTCTWLVFDKAWKHRKYILKPVVMFCFRVFIKFTDLRLVCKQYIITPFKHTVLNTSFSWRLYVSEQWHGLFVSQLLNYKSGTRTFTNEIAFNSLGVLEIPVSALNFCLSYGIFCLVFLQKFIFDYEVASWNIFLISWILKQVHIWHINKPHQQIGNLPTFEVMSPKPE